MIKGLLLNFILVSCKIIDKRYDYTLWMEDSGRTKRIAEKENLGMANKKIMVTQSSMPPYEEYIEAIRPLWESHWLTNMGNYHQELEKRLREYLCVPGLNLMVNGHMALELTIQAMGFPDGAEVITTPFTFISTTHAIVRNRLKPVFCDVKIEDGTIDENRLEDLISQKTVAIVPVHVYGNICNVENIQCIAEKYNLKVIYDAAHAFGVKYKGKGIGSYGDASIFSFHATKVFHTIEGGAVAFSDTGLDEVLYNLKNFGIRGEDKVEAVGANAKMNEFAAIMGLCNLKYIDHVFQERKLRYEKYKMYLKNIKGIRFFDDNPYVETNYAYFPILVEKEYPLDRDGLCDLLRENDFFPRKYFYPLTVDAACFYGEYDRYELENARELSGKVLTLPFYEEIELEDIKTITDLIQNAK